ncbi:MAG: hypothetical protein Q7S58_15210 [Candidatus Binatus sp.]|uniref:hypothetical protein n=1 Tax=Candidatus Binatus sp. TaxID=2811406 RepID=UPI00271692CB|nr:hypothetical protein [Candidatus Binatus sp.]MDO8433751.1 hypothetical protein [Candidatus Binatus sp.]
MLKKSFGWRLAAISWMAILSTSGVFGCATSARPIPITPRVALTPSKGAVTMQARPGKPIGEIVPVDIAIANGTDEPYMVEPSQVFAINQQGQKILPVPPGEAIQEAGDANALKAGLTGAAKNAAVGAIAGAVLGAALGVAVGAMLGAPATGAAYGAAMGGGIGLAQGGVAGGVQGQVAARQDAETQVNALSLQPREANPNFSINGYVFYPKGEYTSIQMNLMNEETHQSETHTTPWEDGEITAAAVGRENGIQASAAPGTTSEATRAPASLSEAGGSVAAQPSASSPPAGSQAKPAGQPLSQQQLEEERRQTHTE